ncbi:MAG: hypothetical protein A2046_14740 [Bacteroidetes bacterium GWA2_30_7]|nr:MAG: hypothetical protein A2046_14740 [Bacteroidetes bacterium GWA2_30_7]
MIHFNLFAPKPNLKFYLGDYYQLARTDKHIDSLSISYKCIDIVKDSMNLALTKIKIANKGSQSIKPNDYTRPLGMIISNCKIINVGVDIDKKDFLTKNLKPRIINDSTIELSNLPFDCNEEVTFNVCILYNWNQIPDYNAIGKIDGMKDKIPTLLEGEDDPFLPKEDLIDIAIIVLIEFATIVLILFLISLFRRAKILKKLNPLGIEKLNPIQEQFVKLYMKLGKKDFLKLITGIVNDDKYINNEEQFLDAFKKVNITRKGLFFFLRKLQHVSPFTRSTKFLIKNNLLKEENEKYTISEELKNEAQITLKRFISSS